jgi:hypothetical protein
MKTRIKAPFATARRTVDVLGVSKSRFKLLERLAHSDTIFSSKASRDGDLTGDVGSSPRKSSSVKTKRRPSARKTIRKPRKSGKEHSGAKH